MTGDLISQTITVMLQADRHHMTDLLTVAFKYGMLPLKPHSASVSILHGSCSGNPLFGVSTPLLVDD